MGGIRIILAESSISSGSRPTSTRNCSGSWRAGRTISGAYPPILKEWQITAQKRGIELDLAHVLSFATVLDAGDPERLPSGVRCRDRRHLRRAGGRSYRRAVPRLRRVSHQRGGRHRGGASCRGSAAAPGEIGRVVVTPLYNYAMPLIRYELGDMAEVGSARPACGRGLPSLRRILGRDRNMFRFRDGSASWPIASRFRLGHFIALKQYQVVQTDFDHVEIRYVSDAPERPINLPAVTERVRTVLRHPVEVSLCRVDQIARSRTGKYEDCISLIPIDWANRR